MLKDVNLYIRLNIVSPIIVQDIINEKIVNKCIYLSIYVIDVNEIIFETCLYVTKSIKVKIILNNNVLEVSQNKINLHLYNK